jgi:hypothetical protein
MEIISQNKFTSAASYGTGRFIPYVIYYVQCFALIII